MATYYVGPRPVLKGLNTNDMVNPYKGTAGTYSYYPLFATSHVLDGFPDNNNIPGTGARPGNRFLSQLFNGTTLYDGTTPLKGTFLNGIGLRFAPYQYKGLTGTKALDGGHAKRSLYYGGYSNYIFDGVTSAEAIPATFGHAPRTEAQGAPYSFGYFRPFDVHGVDSATIFPTNYGQPNQTTIYGRANPKLWVGVPSAQVL
jgi:hypothetical protein